MKYTYVISIVCKEKNRTINGPNAHNMYHKYSTKVLPERNHSNITESTTPVAGQINCEDNDSEELCHNGVVYEVTYKLLIHNDNTHNVKDWSKISSSKCYKPIFQSWDKMPFTCPLSAISKRDLPYTIYSVFKCVCFAVYMCMEGAVFTEQHERLALC